jgi:BrnA antitoxin of type II toxin-antitoxin system
MRKEYDFRGGRRGAVVASVSGKTRITIRLDDDLLNWFRNHVQEAGGGNYQTLINEALRKFIEAQDQPLEEILRKILREELRRSRSGRKAKSRKAA